MPRLQDLHLPLAFKIADAGGPPSKSRDEGGLGFRVAVRSLDGMQKEALVQQVEPPGSTWRMVSDEGPYLQGTDLAPFPLAYFAAGLEFCYMRQVIRLARARGVELASLEVIQDTKYTMTGSALRGDMTGGALPVELLVKVGSPAPAPVVTALVRDALDQSPGHAVMRDVSASAFALQLNGEALGLAGLPPPDEATESPAGDFDRAGAAPGSAYRPDLVTKTATVEPRHGVTGGVGSSLQAEQKRTLHVRAVGHLVGHGHLESGIQLFQPLGSQFRFVADAEDVDLAPPPLAYLSAGVGFCYMTQLGRYAHITKQRLRAMHLVQLNRYHPATSDGRPAGAAPVVTHVFLDADESHEVARRTVKMGEQTCFLHASMRAAYPTVLRAELNGSAL